MSTPSRPSPVVWALLLLILAAAGYVRGYHLGRDCYDCDELFAVRIQGLTPTNLASLLARDGLKSVHPPLQDVPYLPWMAAFGADEAAVRFLPFLCGVAAVGLVFVLGWQLGSPRAGLLAAAVLAVNPLHVTYSQEARNYAQVAVLVTAAHVLMVRCLTRGRWVDLAFYVPVASLALLTHYFATPALFGHLAVAGRLLLSRDPQARTSAARLVGALGLAGLTLAGWAPMTKHQSTVETGYLLPPTAGNLAEGFADVAGVRLGGGWEWAACGLLAGLIGYAAVAGVGRTLAPVAADDRPPFPRWVGWAAILCGLGGLAASLAVVPRFVFPVARGVLEGHGYDAATIDTELGVIRQTLLGYSAATVAIGVVLLAWGMLADRLARLGVSLACFTRPLTGGGVAGLLCVTPVVVVVGVGLLGVPFFTTRNMIVLAPALAVGLGLAFDSLLNHWPGRVLVAGTVVVLALGAARYDATAKPFGSDRDGFRLGLDTPDWRPVVLAIREVRGDSPVVTVNHPETDPLLYYGRDLKVKRLKPDASLAELPPRVVFVHWPGRPDSTGLLVRLQAAGYRVGEGQPGRVQVLVLTR